MTALEPISPEEAKARYQNHRTDLSTKSKQEHGYRIDRFLEFCQNRNLDNMNDMTGRFIDEYAQYRKKQVAVTTVKTEIDTIRKLIEYCESIEACAPGIAERISTPEIVEGDDVRTDRLYPEAAKAILEKLERFEYASMKHVVLLLLWDTGVRRGTLRAFDLEDFENEGTNYVMNAVHRPETDTPLKKKQRGERPIVLKPRIGRVVDDYISENRRDTTDRYGRNPLINTVYGRISEGRIQTIIYELTRPCKFGTGECPIGRDPNKCEASVYNTNASRCPESVSPHAVRRGHMSFMRSRGVAAEKLSERVDASPETINKHYDERTKAEKVDAQRTWLDEVDDGL